MLTVRGRPKWHWVVLTLIVVALLVWLLAGIGTGHGQSGVGNARGDDQGDLSALVTGEGGGEAAQAQPDDSPCAGLSASECMTMESVSYYTDPPQAAPPSVDPPPTVYGPSDPCAGLTGLECETLFDDTYYAPDSPYQVADPPPADNGSGDSYAPPAGDDYCDSVWESGGWDPYC